MYMWFNSTYNSRNYQLPHSFTFLLLETWKPSWVCSFVALSMFHCAGNVSLDPSAERRSDCALYASQITTATWREGSFLPSFFPPQRGNSLFITHRIRASWTPAYAIKGRGVRGNGFGEGHQKFINYHNSVDLNDKSRVIYQSSLMWQYSPNTGRIYSVFAFKLHCLTLCFSQYYATFKKNK